MAEYIEREAALKATTYVETAPPTDIIPLTLHVAQKEIRKIPAADVVEVVRCKDCKYCDQYYPRKEIGKEAEPLVYECLLSGKAQNAEDFCNYGERREGK